jgi:hypothetical protein
VELKGVVVGRAWRIGDQGEVEEDNFLRSKSALVRRFAEDERLLEEETWSVLLEASFGDLDEGTRPKTAAKGVQRDGTDGSALTMLC